MTYAAGKNRDSDAKVVCFFSSEKKALLRATTAMRNPKLRYKDQLSKAELNLKLSGPAAYEPCAQVSSGSARW